MDRFYQAVIKVLVEDIGAAGGSMMLVDRKNGMLKTRAAYPPNPDGKEYRKFKIGEGIAGWVVENCEPHYCADTFKDPLFIEPLRGYTFRSMFSIPLVSQNQAVAVLNVDSLEPDGFDARTQQLLLAFASHIRDRLEKSKLLEALRILAESTTLDLSRALDIILEQLETVISYDSAAVFLIQEQIATVVACRGFPDHENTMQVSIVLDDDLLIEEIKESRRPLILSDATQDPRFRALGDTDYVRGWLCVPLFLKGIIIGYLTVDSQYEDHFTEADGELVSIFAHHAVLAIEGSQYTEGQQGWVDTLMGLHRIGEAISSTLEQENVLSIIVRNTLKFINARLVHLYLYDKSQDTLPLVASEWRDEAVRKPHVPPRPEGMTYAVARTGKRMVIRDVSTNPRFQDHLTFQEITALAGIPLRAGKRVVGVLIVAMDKPQPYQFEQRELDALEVIASQAAVALVNAEHYSATRRRLDLLQQLEKAVETLTQTVRLNLDEVLKVAMTEAQKLAEGDGAFISLFDHESKIFDLKKKQSIGAGVGLIGWTSNQPTPNRFLEELLNQEIVHIDDASGEKAEQLLGPEALDRLAQIGIRAFYGMRLRAGQKIVGALFVNFKKPQIHSPGITETLKVYADYVAIAIVRADLLERLEDGQRLVSNIAKAASTLYDLEETGQEILNGAMELTGAEIGEIGILDGTLQQIQLITAAGPASLPKTNQLRIDDFLQGNPIETLKDPVLIPNLSQRSSDNNAYTPLHKESISAMRVPIVIGGTADLIGILTLECLREAAFNHDVLELMESAAVHAGIAIQNVQLFTAGQNHLAQLQRVLKAGEQIAILRPLRDVLQAITENLRASFSYDVVIFYPFDPKASLFELPVVSGHLSDLDAVKEATIDDKFGRQLLNGEEIYPFIVEERGNDALADMMDREGLQTSGLVPLKISGEWLGLLLVSYRGEHIFDQNEVDAVNLFAGQATNTIHNVRLYSELRQRIEQVENDLAESQGLGERRSLQDTLQKIMDDLIDTYGYANVNLYPFNAKDDTFGHPLLAGQFHDYPKALGLRLKDDSLLGVRLQQGSDEYFVNDMEQENLLKGPFTHREQIKSAASIRLRWGDEIVGLLYVNRLEKHDFGKAERHALRQAAENAAKILHSDRLWQWREHFDRVTGISREVAQRITLDEVLDTLYIQLREFYGPDIMPAVLLYDETRKELLFRPSAQLGYEIDAEEHQGRTSIKVGEGVSGWVAEHLKSRIVKDAVQEKRFLRLNNAVQSEIAVPLLFGDDLIGVLDIESENRDKFNDDDLQMMEAVSNSVASAIWNARKVSQLSRANTVAVMGAWAADVLHDVVREVGAIRTKVLVLQREKEVSDKVLKGLEDIDRYAASLTIAELPQEPLEPGKSYGVQIGTDLDDMVQAEVERRNELFDGVCYRHDLHCPGKAVIIHEQWFFRMLGHLINNAHQAPIADEKDKRIITVRTFLEDNMAEIRVEDNCEGVPLEFQDMVLRDSVPHTDGREGMGLVLVRFLAEQHGGKAKLVWSRLGEGSCFAFQLPVLQ
jgi:GAF domain-containing protein